MAVRTLLASINRAFVGELREDNGLWTFTYASGWIAAEDSFPLAPSLPLQSGPLVDSSTQRPVQWYFDNLLPEEGQRVLLARDARLSDADAFGLLAWYGAESSGSLTLLPPEALLPEDADLRPLSDAELQQRIDQLPRLPLTHHAAKRMSLAGAQHKLPVVLQNDVLFEPVGATPSTHILKPDHADPDYPHSVINEYFIMRLAARLGLQVPAVDRRYVPAPVYLIQRFDRTRTDAGWQRLHCIDACQLLQLDKAYKYSEGRIERLGHLADGCRNRPAARVRLFEWLVFNVLVGNGDAHLKNLSFMVGHEGIALAPHYDLLSTAVYETQAFGKDAWPQRTELAWPILDEHRFSRIDRALLMEAGTRLKLAKTTCARILDAMTGRILGEAYALLSEIEAENASFAAPGQAPTFAGEMRCLRAIVEVVIREMSMQVAR